MAHISGETLRLNVLHAVVGSASAVVLATTLSVAGGAGPAHAATWGHTWTQSDGMEPATTPAEDRFSFESDTSDAWGRIGYSSAIVDDFKVTCTY